MRTTGLVPQGLEIEKAARERITVMQHADFRLSGPTIGSTREAVPVPVELAGVARELAVLAAQFRDVPPEADRRIQHAADFSWLRVGNAMYEFGRPQQAHVIRCLYEAWERSGHRDGSGLREETVGEKIGSAAGRFRVHKLFQDHAALGSILRRKGKSHWALYLSGPTDA